MMARLWMVIALVACSAPPVAPKAPTPARPVAVEPVVKVEEEAPPPPAPASRVRFEPQLANARARAIAWSLDGKYLLVGGETSVTAWDAESGIRLAEVYAPPEVGEYGSVAFYRDRYAIAASFGGAKN